MSPILETFALDIGYPKKKDFELVASDISIKIVPGKLICMVGANGSGKSTLLRTIGGLQKPIAGKINLSGKSISDISTSEISKTISLVLTDKIPSGNFTVEELIAIGRQPYTNWIGKLRETDNKLINDAIEITGIRHLANRKFFELSDGQLQIVMIARALAQDTPLIILDEPSTHLDLPHKASLFRLLKKLAHERGKSILFSTHDIEIALQVCDEIIVVADAKAWQENLQTFVSNDSHRKMFNDDKISFDADRMKFNLDLD